MFDNSHLIGHRFVRITMATVLAISPLVIASGSRATAGAGPKVSCDFDGNGRSDLATSAPGEAPNGAVIINYNHQHQMLLDHVQMIKPPGAEGEVAGGFGYSMACGDFNSDGVDDLAVGAPLSFGTGVNDDAVHVGRFYIFDGANDVGLTGAPRWFTQNNAGLVGLADQDKLDKFGAAMVTGDFNGDGHDDLAVGAPGDNDVADGGSVTVAYGPIANALNGHMLASIAQPGDVLDTARFGEALGSGKMGPSAGDDLVVGAPGTLRNGEQGRVYVYSDATIAVRLIHASDFNVTSAGDNEDFGSSLAVGDFNGNGYAGVAIGAPKFTSPKNPVAGAGAVFVAGGTSNGPVAGAGGMFDQAGVGWVSEVDDRFGHALAAVDLDGNGTADLAIGAPLEDVNGVSDAGAVVVRMTARRSSGLSWSASHTYHQGLNVGDQLETGDLFGASLAGGWFGADPTADLIIGAPGEGPDAIWPFAGDDVGRVFIGLGWPSHLGQTWFGQDILPGMSFGESTISNGHFGDIFTTGESTGWAIAS